MAFGRRLAYGLSWIAKRMLAPLERYALAPAAVALLGWTLYRGDFEAWRWPGLVAMLMVAALLAHKLLRVYRTGGRFAGTTDLPTGEVLQIELLALGAVTVLLQMTGGHHSPLYPLLWLLLAAVGGLDAEKRRNLWVVIAVALAFELLPLAGPIVQGRLEPQAAWDRFGWRLVIHAVALVAFGRVSRLLVAAHARHLKELARRDAHTVRARIEHERRDREQKVREYRLEGTLAGLDAEKRSRPLRQQSSLDTLQGRVDSLLRILLESYRAHAVAFFLLLEDGCAVKLMGQVRALDVPDRFLPGEIPAGKGVIGAILKRNDLVSFDHARWDPDRFPYYAERVELKTFLGVPVPGREGLDPRGRPLPCGVLLADRTAEVGFSEDDAELMKSVARELLHSIDTERALSGTEKLGGLLEASEQLSRAVSLADVVDEVLVQVRNLLPQAEFTAIALRQGEQDDRAWLAGVKTSPAFAGFKEQHLQHDIEPGCLCHQAIKDCCTLPARSFAHRSRDQKQVFGKDMPLSGLAALKCLPLKVAGTQGRKSQPGEEKAIGALVIAGRDPDLFPEDKREEQAVVKMIETLTNFGAISIQNAQRWEKLERLATTDGLTGLHNHRRFKEMLDEEVKASLRYDRRLALILTDIDHFKQVNDNYGHPMGDEVLRRVARVLAELAREADRVCRYGGEEFTVILPETDAAGARMLAERFREKIKEQSFTFAGKTFRVTLSLGICTLPENARHSQELIDRADQALYHAKRNGRDRSVHYTDIATQGNLGSLT